MAKKTQKRMPRRREEFTYRGHSIADLQQMALSELLPLMPARARRKFDRGLSGAEKLLADIRSGEATHSPARHGHHARDGWEDRRDHNGKGFQKVEIQPEAVFHYLESFALTRKKVSPGGAGIGATRSSKYVPLK